MSRVVGSRTLFRGRLLALREDEVEFPNGRRIRFEVLEHPGAVAIVPVTTDGHVLLVRQFRAAMGADLLEVPAGTLEPGEAPEACARRELVEETGHAAARWEPLGRFYVAPGYTTEVIHLFLARDLRPAPAGSEGEDLRDEEDLRVEAVPLADARRRVETGEIRDAKSIIGILTACARLGP